MLIFDVIGRLSKLMADYTTTRAGALDLVNTRLDNTITSRASSTDTTTLLSRVSASRAGYLDNLQYLTHTIRPPTSINQGHGKTFPTGYNRGYLPGQTSTVSCNVGVDTTLFSISAAAPGGAILFFSFAGTNAVGVSSQMKTYVDGSLIQTLTTTLQNVYQHTVVGAAVTNNLATNDVMISLGLLRFNSSFSMVINPTSTISVQYNVLYQLF